jgi:photosystem II stability/assembly factor-like uncharacterized protein
MNKQLAAKLCVVAMFLTALIPSSASAFGQKWDFGRDWTLLNGSGYSNNSYAVATSDDGKIIYSISSTSVYYSGDSGATWSQRNSGITGNSFWDVATNADGSIVTAVQNGGNIWVSRNFGVTWEQRTNVTTPNGSGLGGWLNVAMSDTGQYIVTTRNGLFYRSTDYGQTFIERTIDSRISGNSDQIPVIDISGDGRNIIVPTNQNTNVYISTNFGTSFFAVGALPSLSWASAGISGDGNTLVAAAYGNNIWVSHDAGSTWTETVIDLAPQYKSWGRTALSYDGQIIGLTRYGYKLITSDTGGNSWEVKPKSPSQMWRGIATSRDGRVMYAAAILDHGSGGVYLSVPTYIYTDYGQVTLLLDPCWESYDFTSVQAASVVLMGDTASAIANGDDSTYTYFSETDTALWGANYNYGSIQDQNTCIENKMNGTVTLTRGRFISSTNSVVLSETTTNTTDFIQYIGNIESGGTYSGLPCGNMGVLRNTSNVTTSCTTAIQADYQQLTHSNQVQVRDSSIKLGTLGQNSGKIYTFVKVLNSAITGAPRANKWVATETFTVTSS